MKYQERISKVKHITECISHDIPAGARFCIACGMPVAATGSTQRLDSKSIEVRYDEIVYEGDTQRIVIRKYRKPLGYLNGDPIYTYDPAIWSDINFTEVNDFADFI